MTVVVTGGGSGGHITPILAVAKELKQLQSDIRIVYIGQRGDGLSDVVMSDPHIDEVFNITAGKFRRYHGEGWRQLYDVPTQAKNLLDIFRVAIGLGQSLRLMYRLRPAIIFTRGGFVSVPVALGGKLAGVPYITHDSDSTPSLANRIIARWAKLHAVALPKDVYPYSSERTITVGVPVSSNYVPVTSRLCSHYRKLLRLEEYDQVLLITGGGNGARKLNNIMVENIPYLLRRYPRLVVLHIAGRNLQAETIRQYEAKLSAEDRKRVIVHGFVTDLYRFSGAATVVVARGGATNLAEFAIQGKACLIIPSPQLEWNVKNSHVMVERQAVLQLTEDQAEQELRVATVLAVLFDDETKRLKLSKNLAKLAHPGSAQELAVLLLKIATPNNSGQSYETEA